MKILPNDLPLKHWLGVATSNGISRRTFLYRLDKYAPSVAATMPLQCKGPSPRPNSPRQISLRAGLSENAINNYRRYHANTTLTDEQIIAKLTKRREALAKGESLNAKAKAAGLHLTTVQKRLKRGKTLQQALSEPPMTPRQAGESRRNSNATNKRVK